jgi:DNA-binding XRE family transcriptional regulator
MPCRDECAFVADCAAAGYHAFGLAQVVFEATIRDIMLSPDNLRAIRAFRKLTQAELASRASLSVHAVAEYELGKRDLRCASMRRLCDALGVQVSTHVEGLGNRHARECV